MSDLDPQQLKPAKPHLKLVDEYEGLTEEAVAEKIYETNFRDVAAMLRKTADDIEANEYGPIGTAALVLFGNRLEVFGFGPDCDGGSVSLILQAANNILLMPIITHGNEG